MSKSSLKKFDANAIGMLEARMWQAYYAHHFIKLLFIIMKMFRKQFGVSWVTSIRLAYYSGKATIMFRKTENKKAIIILLTKYYRLTNKHALETIPFEECAKRELHWWMVHRYPKKYDESLANAVSRAMTAYYSLNDNELVSYGKYRADAMHIRDHATHVTKTEPDWREIEALLVKSYNSLHDSVNR